MEIAEVQEADSLARFLTTEHPALAHSLSHRLATRATARIMPYAVHFLLSSPRPRKRGYTPVDGLLALLIGEVESVQAAQAIYLEDNFVLPEQLSRQIEYLNSLTNAAHAFDRAAATSNVLSAARTIMDRGHLPDTYAEACSLCAGALHELEENAYANDLAWGAVRADLEQATGGDWNLAAPLWLIGDVPGSVAKAWGSAKKLMLEDEANQWSVWIAWYERLRDGHDVLNAEMPGILVGVFTGRKVFSPDWVNPRLAHILERFESMVRRDVRDVRDRKSLEEYLTNLPPAEVQAVAQRVAFRAAARVLPFAMQAYGADVEESLKNLWTVPVLGALAVASVADAAPGAVSDGAAYATSLAVAAAAEKTIGGASRNALLDLVSDPEPEQISRAAGRARRTSASVTAISAAVTAVASTDAVPAALAAVAAACEAEDLWDWVRDDLAGHVTDIWGQKHAPETLVRAHARMGVTMEDDQSANWTFWQLWFDKVVDGQDILPDAVAKVLNTFLEKADWERGPAHINPLFDDVLALYRGEGPDAAPTELAQAAPVEFSFDTLARVMRMVGITDNLGHLKEPGIVQAFVDDAEEVRDLFQDFADYAGELQGGGNYAGILKRAAEKVLGEFDRTEDKMHLRANRLVILASELELFSKDGRARDDLGETLSGLLDTRIEMLKGLCRQHFGPSYLALAPLAQLRLEQVDQQEVIAIFDHAIGFVEALPNPEMVALDAEGVAVLRDMLEELRTYRAAIAEATSDDFQTLLEDRFAQSSGALGLSLTRFYERSVTASGKVGKAADAVIKQNKRVTSLLDIVEAVSSGFGG